MLYLTPNRNSYYIDLIAKQIGLHVLDLYSYPPDWPLKLEQSKSLGKQVIIIDDESLVSIRGKTGLGQYDMFRDSRITHDNPVYVVKNDAVKQALETHGLSVVKCPWLFSIDDAISINQNSFMNPVRHATDKWNNFCSLNNNFRMHKGYLIKQLYCAELGTSGLITANDKRFNHYRPAPMDHYYFMDSVGYERVATKPVLSTTNAFNFSYINDTIDSCINISVETSIRNFFPTEKTLQPIAVGRIPIWVGKMGMVEEVRQQGFDVFDDIIDHSYDTIYNPKERIKATIQLNKPLLSSSGVIDVYNSVIPRLISNREHFLTNWLRDVTNKLIDDIKEKL